MKKYKFALTSLSILVGLVTLVIWSEGVPRAKAHCQVPCGIYDDPARIRGLYEDAATIAKAIDNIAKLSGKTDAESVNQLTRWINTKEDHASHIIKVVSEYFLTQKVKPVAAGSDGYDAYLKALADHHAVLAAAMKTKQKPDLGNVRSLQGAIHTMQHHYEKHNH
jgi:nickel superoxide dismutase